MVLDGWRHGAPREFAGNHFKHLAEVCTKASVRCLEVHRRANAFAGELVRLRRGGLALVQEFAEVFGRQCTLFEASAVVDPHHKKFRGELGTCKALNDACRCCCC